MMEMFDEEAVYDNEIDPLMREVIAICREHKIPMFASFVFENHEEKGEGLLYALINNFKGRYSGALEECANVIESLPEKAK